MLREFWARNEASALALAFLLVSVVLGLVAPAPQPVYAVEGNLLFVRPNASVGGNALRAESPGTVFFAAAVEREYNVTPDTARLASTAATLYGIGVRDGSRVTLPSGGGQWTNSFDRPYLRVEVVSGSPGQSEERFRGIVAELTSIAEKRQMEAEVTPQAMVHLELTPPSPVVQQVSGSRTRVVAAAVLLGLLGACGVLSLAGGRTPFPDPGPASDGHDAPVDGDEPSAADWRLPEDVSRHSMSSLDGHEMTTR